MTVEKIPFPKLMIKDDIVTHENSEGAELIDVYIDERGNFRKRPALKSTFDLGVSTGIDGLFWWTEKKVAVAVSGGRFYKLTNKSGTFEDITGTETMQIGVPVSFTNNATHMVAANGTKMFLWAGDATNPFTVTDTDAPTTVSHVGFIDRYIVALEKGKQLFWYSAVADATTWTSTGFGRPESSPDDLIALLVNNGEINLLGEKSFEFWYNDLSTPFRRIQSATLPNGCLSPHSLVETGGSVIWMDDKRGILQLIGRNPRVISTLIDDKLREISPVSDAVAFFFKWGRRAFYVINFPTDNTSWAFDLTTQIWYQWGNWDLTNAVYKEFKGKNHIYSSDWDVHLMGDANDGKIYTVDQNSFQDGSDAIRSVIRTGHIDYGSTRKKKSREIRLKVKRAAGGTTSNEPLFTIRYRDENGDWGKYRQGSLGKQGEHEYIVKFRKNGEYRTRQLEVSHGENTDFILVGGEEEFDWLEN